MSPPLNIGRHQTFKPDNLAICLGLIITGAGGCQNFVLQTNVQKRDKTVASRLPSPVVIMQLQSTAGVNIDIDVPPSQDRVMLRRRKV